MERRLAVLLAADVVGYLPITSAKYQVHRLSGDYAKVAAALGGYSERVERVAEQAPAIARCIAEVEGGRPALLEVITREEAEFPKG